MLASADRFSECAPSLRKIEAFDYQYKNASLNYEIYRSNSMTNRSTTLSNRCINAASAGRVGTR